MSRQILWFLVFLFLLAQQAAAEETYYVHSVSTKVYEKPSLAAKVVGEAAQGRSFPGSLRQGNWIRVKFADRDAFVSAFAVGTSPPQKRVGAIVSSDSQPQGNARTRVSSSRTIVAGVKGLTYENRNRANKKDGVNFDDLELMESVKIDPRELEKFAPGGAR